MIPNRAVYPALVLALAVSPAWTDRGPWAALGGGLGAFAVMALARRLSRGGLGGGDVRLAALVGAVVGYPGVLAAGVVTAAAGGLLAAAPAAIGRARRGTRVALRAAARAAELLR